MDRRVGIFAAIAVATTGRLAHADVASASPDIDGAAELAFGGRMIEPTLAGVAFEGVGTPRGGDRRQHFAHNGRDLGVDAPALWGCELSLHYARRYFIVGAMAFLAWHPGGAGSATDAIAAAQVDGSAVSGGGGGVDLALALPLGPVDILPGGLLGLQRFSVPMTGFEKTTCTTKRGSYPCDDDARTSFLVFVEPRIRVELGGEKLGGFLYGAYLGMQVGETFGPSAGIFVGGHTRHSSLLP